MPNPLPFWETAYKPETKSDRITICYTPFGRHEKGIIYLTNPSVKILAANGRIRTPNGRTAKYAEMKCAEITLHNGDGWRETFFRLEVEMLGVVVRVERDLTVKR